MFKIFKEFKHVIVKGIYSKLLFTEECLRNEFKGYVEDS